MVCSIEIAFRCISRLHHNLTFDANTILELICCELNLRDIGSNIKWMLLQLLFIKTFQLYSSDIKALYHMIVMLLYQSNSSGNKK